MTEDPSASEVDGADGTDGTRFDPPSRGVLRSVWRVLAGPEQDDTYWLTRWVLLRSATAA